MSAINTVFFGCGGAKCLTYIGAIRVAIEKKVIQIENIHTWGGVSGGSFLALLMVLGMSPSAMETFFTLVNLEHLLLDTHTAWGILEGRRLEVLVRTILQEKIQREDITFRELFSLTGKELMFQTTNLTKRTIEIWSNQTTPEMSVLTALRTSMAIPLLFAPTIYNGCFYIDGGIIQSFMTPREPERTLHLRIKNEVQEGVQYEDMCDYLVDIVTLFFYFSESSQVTYPNTFFFHILASDPVLVAPDSHTCKSLIDFGYEQMYKAVNTSSEHEDHNNDRRDGVDEDTGQHGSEI